MARPWTFQEKLKWKKLKEIEIIINIIEKIANTMHVTSLNSFWHICAIIKHSKGAKHMWYKVVYLFLAVIWLNRTWTQVFSLLQLEEKKSAYPTLLSKPSICQISNFFFFAWTISYIPNGECVIFLCSTSAV